VIISAGLEGFQMKDILKVNAFDLGLGAVILFFSISSVFSITENGGAGVKTATIFKDGTRIDSVSLDRDRLVDVDHMTLEVHDGKIRILRSDCPKKVCVHSGWASMPSHTIVCVPNRIIVEISEQKNESEKEYHAVSY
jgi:hypothetical protein